MLTMSKKNGRINRETSQFECLQKDVANLPKNADINKPFGVIQNGSIALVMDTSRVYIFSEEDDKWYEL